MANPFYILFSTHRSVGPFVLRIALAVIFFVHGSQKAFGWFGGDGWARTIEGFTRPDAMGLPYVLAAADIVGEMLLSIAFLLGFLTRIAALGVIVIMLGAIYFVHYPGGFAEMEFPLTVMAVAINLLIQGGGRFSIDRGVASLLLPTIG